MTEYYFLSSLLPDLQIGVPPDIDSEELKALIDINLSKEDKEKIHQFRIYYDLLNLRSLWKNEKFSYRGNYNHESLEDLLLHHEGFPSFVFDYLDKNEKIEDRIHNFTALIARYFKESIQNSEGFLKKYLTMERDFRIILTALRTKKLQRNLLQEFQYEDPHDSLVSQIIAQKDSSHLELPEEYEELQEIFEENWEDPLKLHHEFNDYKLQKIDEISTMDFFSVDRVLAYLAKLTIIEQDLELDKEEGKNKVDMILKEAR